MIRPTKNPLSPNSLAADGNQGAEAKALGPCGAQDNPQAASARILALTAVHGARGQLDRYALVTDTPARGVVEAADLPDAVAECLTPVAGFPDRSEEHTSELQSLMRISYAVFCLKNKKERLRARTTEYPLQTRIG